MSTYVQILSTQSPFPIGVDEANRSMFSCNFNAESVDWATSPENEIVRILSNAGLVTESISGRDVFIGPNATIPSGNGPYTQIMVSSSMPPFETHNGDIYEQFSFQTIVRALSYTIARDKARAIQQALDGLRNYTITL